jgi:hypothetical protein
VRRHWLLSKANSLAKNVSTHESSHTSVDVHDRAASKIEGTLVKQVTTRTPDHVSDWNVGKGEPEDREEQDRAELDALGKRAHD